MRYFRLLLLCLPFALLATSCETGLDDYGFVNSQIIGGTAVTDGSWPAVGAVTLYPDSMCSGTLIAPRIVVTAAHCVKGENPTMFTLGYDMDNGTDYTVSAAYYNPDYDEGGWDDPGSGDVGILVLKNEVTGVTPADLFQGDFTQFDGEDITFVGYGKRSVNQALYGLKYQVTLTIEDIDADGFWNYTSQSDTHNTCGGDSGGPGFILSGGKYFIGGFVSSGDEYCVEDGYNMRADANAEWLLSMIEKYGGGSTTEVCGNGQCESGETATSCPADCGGTSNIWDECDENYECDGDMFCLQVDTSEYRCTIECDDLELGGGCGVSSMACYELDDGSGACIEVGLVCGDGLCEYGETASSCPIDCDKDCGDLTYEGCCDGTRAVYCDNGQYREVECGPDYVCGWVADGEYYFCTEGTAGEDPSGLLPMSCESFTYQACGDGECTGTEDHDNCASDCPATDTCGNDTCDDGETPESCPADCVEEDTCGNDVCDDGETAESCPADCAEEDTCGNDVCDNGETATSCPADCGSTDTCGNDICEAGETCVKCPADCGECRDVIEGSDTSVNDVAVTGDATDSTDNGGSTGGGGCTAGSTPGGFDGLLLLLPFAGLLLARRRLRSRC